MKNRLSTCLLWTLAVLCPCIRTVSAAPVPAQIAEDGKAQMPVTVSPDASRRVRKAAEDLARYLGKMCADTVPVGEGDGTEGVAVGTHTDFPELRLSALFDENDLGRREEYLLRSHGRGVYVIGATDLGVEDAVWDFLHRLGYRQFFPGPKWEIIPPVRHLSLAVDTFHKPSYVQRGIWYNWNLQEYNLEPYYDWCAKNRLIVPINYNAGHVWELIYDLSQPVFDAHPEYLALADGKRTADCRKFCVSNPDLRRVILNYSMRSLAHDPSLDGISVEPSDGSGWCECQNCNAMGVLANRTVTLANEVAAAIEAKYGKSKVVGLQAYYMHAMPPTIKVHPNVVVTIATSFIPAPYTLDQLLTGWQGQEATIGIREYYNVWDWSHDLPGNSNGANTGYLQESITRFHTAGARYMSAESGDNWGPNGLGYYLASRMLWDVGEAARIPELTRDFLEKCFGPAAQVMSEFYALIDGANKPKMSTDLVGRMYRHLAEARQLAPDPAIRARLNDLVLYTRYVELYQAYANAPVAQRQAAVEAFIRFTYRMRTSMMVHEYAVYRQTNKDRSIVIPAEAQMGVPEGQNPWKSSAPFAEEELGGILAAGIDANRLNDWIVPEYNSPLVPSGLPGSDAATKAGGATGLAQFYVWADQDAALPVFTVPKGNEPVGVTWTLYADDGRELETGKVPHEDLPAVITPAARGPGVFRLDVVSKYYGIFWDKPPGARVSLFMKPARFMYEWSGFFYVPKGTRDVVIYGLLGATLYDRSGAPIEFTAAGGTEYTIIPVKPGQDRQAWFASVFHGVNVSFETIPPYFALSPDDLLVPVEIREEIAAAAEP